MGHDPGSETESTDTQVERSLRRCLEWSQLGQHRKVLAEVERILPITEEHPQLEASLLIWKAQALFAMGCSERALPSASRSWDLEPSPHACHLMSIALEALGDAEGAEEFLRMGWQLFPDAIHLPVQLVVILSDQGRLPEALDTLDEIPDDDRLPKDLEIFLFGMRSNLLATMGRWAEADEVLQEGMTRHPDSELLGEAHDSLRGARKRARAERDLADSWEESLGELEGVAVEVDDAIVLCGTVNELSELVILAARRLWRAYYKQHVARPQVPNSWGTAMVLAVLEVDGDEPSAAAFARSAGCKPSGVRSVLARLRKFLAELDAEFSARAFAAHANPRLDEPQVTTRSGAGPADVLPFPTK